jgi:enterochelin esterase-like enzyme
LALLLTILVAGETCAQQAPSFNRSTLPAYPRTYSADLQPQPGVPKGTSFHFTLDHSKIFPGTTRSITVYVPAEYTGERPACVYVGLDTIDMQHFDFHVSVVFDNLIYRREMPVTIAIGVSPGTLESADPPHNPRFNRSLEFDGLSPNLAQFLLEEVFPEVERHTNPNNIPIRLSTNPDNRAVGGFSTGGIGAFTLAWESPDAFRRVYTGIGSYVGMRGADRYPVLIRKTEPKPIRIFMQDGSKDEWGGGPEFGDWWISNQNVERALEFAGYATAHEWGEGTHDVKDWAATFPAAMRWLWKDWPLSISPGESQNTFLKAILLRGETWELTSEDDPQVRAIAKSLNAHLTRDTEGRTYQTDEESGEVWLIDRGGGRRLLDSGLKSPSGIAITPDGLWLAIAERASHWGYSYRLLPDGTLQDKQRFYWFHVPDTADDSGAGGLSVDCAGRLYAATRLGVQVFDRNGRVRTILSLPGGQVTDLAFGGDDMSILYARTLRGQIYRRRLNVTGFAPGSPPIELPPWSAS